VPELTVETIAEFDSVLDDMLNDTFDIVHTTNDWVRLPAEVQQALRDFVNKGQALFEKVLRPKMDQAIWNGLAAPGVDSIRTKGEYESKPGRKPPTAAEVLARATKR
jgi:hypothetical protein